ncbi:tetratricopeptide repeat protein [Candidatus Darwinibacter acetoxidans]
MPFQILMVFVCVLGADVPDRDQLEEIAARMATRHEDLYDSAASNALFTFANAWASDFIPERATACEFFVEALIDQAPSTASARSYFMAARVSELIGNEERAIGILRELAEKRGEEEAGRFGIVAVAVPANMQLGRLLLEAGRFEEAIEAYEQSAKAVEDEPNRVFVAWNYLKIGEIQAMFLDDRLSASETFARLREIAIETSIPSRPVLSDVWAQRIVEQFDKGSSSIVCPEKTMDDPARFIERIAMFSGMSLEAGDLNGGSNGDRLGDFALDKVLSQTESGVDREVAAFTLALNKAKLGHFAGAEGILRDLFSSTAFMAPQAGLKLADLLVRRDREQEAARVLDTLESRWPSYYPNATRARERYYESGNRNPFWKTEMSQPPPSGYSPPTPSATTETLILRPDQIQQAGAVEMAKPGQKHKDLPRPPVDNGRNDSRRLGYLSAVITGILVAVFVTVAMRTVAALRRAR